MTFLDQYQLAHDPDFAARVTVAATKAALNVLAEAEPTAERAAYAATILRNPTGAAQTIALAVVANPAIDGNSPDDAIEFTVNSVFTSMAAVPAPVSQVAQMEPA